MDELLEEDLVEAGYPVAAGHLEERAAGLLEERAAGLLEEQAPGHLEERAAEVHGVDDLSAEVAVDRGPLADSPAGLLGKLVAGPLGLRRPQAEVEVEPPFALGDSGVLSTPERLWRRQPSRMASVDPLKIWKQQVLD